MQRASVALAVNGGCLLFAPVDAEGLDDTLEGVGRVLGVCPLLDRHGRDGAALAARHGAPRLDPPSELGRFDGVQPELELRDVYRARRWHETAVWLKTPRLLIVPETVGAVPFFVRSRKIGSASIRSRGSSRRAPHSRGSRRRRSPWAMERR